MQGGRGLFVGGRRRTLGRVSGGWDLLRIGDWAGIKFWIVLRCLGVYSHAPHPPQPPSAPRGSSFSKLNLGGINA